MSKYYQHPTISKHHRQRLLALTLAPFGVAILVFAAVRGAPGAAAAVLAFFGLFQMCANRRARMIADIAYAQWGAYLPPGHPDGPTYAQRRGSGATVLRASEIGMGGPLVEEWLLDDGAVIGEISQCWSSSADKRYTAAMTDARQGHSFVVYDRSEHVCYHYENDKAGEIFSRLYGNTIDAKLLSSTEKNASVLESVLRCARREPYFGCRGLWLPEAMRDTVPADLITREIAPGIALSAAWHAPADLRTLANPFGPIELPLRRLLVNGAATGLWCYDLQALAASDGQSFAVKGCVIDQQEDGGDGRWYLWRKDCGWIAMDDKICEADGELVGRLAAVTALADGVASFVVRLEKPAAKGGYVQTALHAAPLKVSINTEQDAATCQTRMPNQGTGAKRLE